MKRSTPQQEYDYDTSTTYNICELEITHPNDKVRIIHIIWEFIEVPHIENVNWIVVNLDLYQSKLIT